jgi:hypothetical protein
MEALYALAIAVAALLVAAGVSLFTRKILDRQAQLAKQVNELAGVLRVRTVAEAGPYESFHDVLSSRLPTTRLDVWAVSGWTVLQPEVVERLLEAGVVIRALLLDPASETWLLKEHSWLAAEARQTLERVHELVRSSRSLEIRLYQESQFQMLLFVDNDRAFVSSFFPITSHLRLVYEIAPGDKSLYQLYREAFEYVWQRSIKFN